MRHTASCPKNKKMSAVPTGSSFRHVIITVVCDVVKHIAQLVQLVVIKHLDGIDDDALRRNSAVLALCLCHRIVRRRTELVKIRVHGLSLFFLGYAGRKHKKHPDHSESSREISCVSCDKARQLQCRGERRCPNPSSLHGYVPEIMTRSPSPPVAAAAARVWRLP